MAANPWTMLDAPSDRDYYGSGDEPDDDEPEDEEEAEHE